MNVLISFDAETAVAIVRVATWEQVLKVALRAVFTVTDEILRLDYSHLSAEPSEGKWPYYDRRSARERLVEALMEADALGQL